jgi:glycosyltransferase involved in cell wall biosynthesis
MRIGYFVNHFPYPELVGEKSYQQLYAHGGTEIAAYKLAEAMVKRGHHVEVFTTAIGSHDHVDHYQGIIINRYSTNLKLSSANLSLNLMRKPLKHYLDLVHAHYNIPTPDLSALRYSHKKKVPLVVTYHNDAQESGGSFLINSSHRIYNRSLLKRVLGSADAIIATSYSYIGYSKYLDEYKNKIKVIPNGISLQELQTKHNQSWCRAKLNLPPHKKIILFLGNLVPYKGPDILLTAASILDKVYDDFIVIFAGRGPMQDKLVRQSWLMDISNRVIFTEFVPEELKKYYFHAADIFCLPSINPAEAFGIVNLEAMAAGLPIVSTRMGGIPDLVKDGENGFLVPPENPHKLAEALLQLLEHPELVEKIGAHNLKLSLNYDWDKIAKNTEKLYLELLKGDI